MSRNISILFTILITTSILAQNKSAIILTIDNDSVSVADFMRVYNKNLNLVKDETQKDINNYLSLFKDYHLKLKEAKRLQLHETNKYKSELKRYKKQLIESYTSETEVTDALIEEAYERLKYDINASHALVRLDKFATDTTDAFTKISELRTQIIDKGYDIIKSEAHNGEKIIFEDLGFFTAFRMVYDFENAAYNTPIGKVSQPFRTAFGYHVVKINNKTLSKGTLSAAHIMVALKQDDSLVNPEERINSIYKKLQQGETFEALAKQFSNDKVSANNGGVIKPFSRGLTGSEIFENQAFNLEKDGDISSPFKTRFGWHIVKRHSLKPIGTIEDEKQSLEQRIIKDKRSHLIKDALVSKLKSKYTIVENKEAKPYMVKILKDIIAFEELNLPKDFKAEKNLLSINDTNYTLSDFAKFVFNNIRNYSITASEEVIFDNEYNAFFKESILQYRRDNLEFENKDYANTLQEYREGLLMFDVMEQEVWHKAAKDSMGLKTYFDNNKTNYKFDKRISISMASMPNKKEAKKVLKLMQSNAEEDLISQNLNTSNTQNVIFTRGTYSINASILPKQLKIDKGVSKIYKHNEAYHVVNIKDIKPEAFKKFDEARGQVLTDYQAFYEKQWLDTLKKRYKIIVNNEVLKTIKASVNN